jgi:hypothetical protein
MITTVDSLEATLGLDFTLACSDLTEARCRQGAKDTPGNRTAVAEAQARIDAVLDMYLDAVVRGG